ncbi:MAG TPA: hypothetical protein VGR84_18685 [Candidatus Acidoferrales bacterium]|nr:hypothetical protein [Candidatus Acidoferrales bacterium]
MRILDPGHRHELTSLDGGPAFVIHFCKRIGDGYPGNIGSPVPGPNCQEYLRALIERASYLNGQFWCLETTLIRWLLIGALWLFEARAARIKHRWPPSLKKCLHGRICPACGHVGCRQHKD